MSEVCEQRHFLAWWMRCTGGYGGPSHGAWFRWGLSLATVGLCPSICCARRSVDRQFMMLHASRLRFRVEDWFWSKSNRNPFLGIHLCCFLMQVLGLLTVRCFLVSNFLVKVQVKCSILWMVCLFGYLLYPSGPLFWICLLFSWFKLANLNMIMQRKSSGLWWFVYYFLVCIWFIYTHDCMNILQLNSYMYCFGFVVKKMCKLISIIWMMIIFQALQPGQLRAKFVSFIESLACDHDYKVLYVGWIKNGMTNWKYQVLSILLVFCLKVWHD